jgi:hypothetical protein
MNLHRLPSFGSRSNSKPRTVQQALLATATTITLPKPQHDVKILESDVREDAQERLLSSSTRASSLPFRRQHNVPSSNTKNVGNRVTWYSNMISYMSTRIIDAISTSRGRGTQTNEHGSKCSSNLRGHREGRPKQTRHPEIQSKCATNAEKCVVMSEQSHPISTWATLGKQEQPQARVHRYKQNG